MKTVSKIEDNNLELDLDQIIDKYTPYIKTIINNMGNSLSYEDKEEILADTFFILWKNREKQILSIDSYIAGITRNLVKEKFRKHNYTYDLSDYENIIEYNNDINFYNSEREFIENLKSTFNILNPIDIDILNMFYYSSYSIKEISKKLNISELNVRTKLCRIRKKIKKDFDKKETKYE